jgi:predicted metalloprotease
MVFNINFGGAVIYDTQRAAEQALADRITNLQNTRRRGAPRRAY